MSEWRLYEVFVAQQACHSNHKHVGRVHRSLTMK